MRDVDRRQSDHSVENADQDNANTSLERLGYVQLWAITALNLAYGFMLADMGILVAPLEAERLFPDWASYGLGAMAVCTGLAQLVGPAAGYFSDHYQSRHGRRGPCLVQFTGVACAFTLFLLVASDLQLPVLYVLAFFAQQLAWNAIFSVQAGLVPDIVPADQRGLAGGIVAANILVGALAALLGVRCFGASLALNYLLIVILGIVCCVIVCVAATEQSSEHNFWLCGNNEVAFTPRNFYWLDVQRNPEFAKLMLSKMMYSASVMVKGFLLFFVQDTFLLRSLDKEQVIAGDAAIAAEATAALSAMFGILWMGTLANRDTTVDEETQPLNTPMVKQPEALPFARFAAVFGACWMGLLWFGPTLVAWRVLINVQTTTGVLKHEHVAEAWAPWVVIGTGAWGIGQGIYLLGDQTLGFALIPDQQESARYLGLTSVCCCLGAVLGGSGAAALLHAFGSYDLDEENIADAPRYYFRGYAAIFAMATLLSWICAWTLLNIHNRPKSRAKVQDY
eukprot:CAMPEP_0117500358 /NCGR_PEP_ID=MMETSP0784-20121206/22735_1 /TAXON_ID=39447 /ORGANISM="" /LENGTH=507 /DNA_ID=CAMNT_0005295565 /DNA_START=117 /DNA_END=1640 /DNA_ORIENTATION=+